MTDGKRTSNERHIGGDGSRRPSVLWLPGEDGVGLQEERGGAVCPTPDLVAGGGDGRRPGGAGCLRLADKDGRVVLACVRFVEEDGGFWSASATTSEA